MPPKSVVRSQKGKPWEWCCPLNVDRPQTTMSLTSSTARRRSTVHDFSTLRLHPDGSRVAIHSPARIGFRFSRMRNTGRDTRGNRVARDAAGLGVVPKRMVIRDDSNDDGPDEGEEEEDNIETRKSKRRILPRRKRPRIDDNVEFLGDPRNSARCTGDKAIVKNEESMNWPVPSSVRLSLSSIYDTLTVRT